MPLGGALRGILPNPTLVTDEASLVIGQRVFTPRARDAARELLASTSTSSGDDLDFIRTFLPPPLRIPKVQAGTNVTIVENALGPVISATAGSSVPEDGDVLNAHRSFLPRPFGERPVNDAQAIAAQLAHQPHVQRQSKVQAGTNITIVENAQGPIISAAASSSTADDGSTIDAHRAFLPNTYRPLDVGEAAAVLAQKAFAAKVKVPDLRAGTNITLAQDAAGTIVSTTAVDDATDVLASRAFLPRPGPIPPPPDDAAALGAARAFLRHPDAPAVPVNDAAQLLAVAASLPHPGRLPKVQAGTNVTIAENALGPVISATAGSSTPDDGDTVNAHRSFLSNVIAYIPTSALSLSALYLDADFLIPALKFADVSGTIELAAGVVLEIAATGCLEVG